MSTFASLAATLWTSSSTSCIFRLLPTMLPYWKRSSSCRFSASFSPTSCRRSSARSTQVSSAPGSTGFSMKLCAPARIASTALGTVAWPVRTITSDSASI